MRRALNTGKYRKGLPYKKKYMFNAVEDAKELE